MAATNLVLDFKNSVTRMEVNGHYIKVSMIPKLKEELSTVNEVNDTRIVRLPT